MRPPPKKQRLAVMETDLLEASVADLLSIDVLANIFGYLDGPKDIMQKRRVCKKWMEAVKNTVVPPIEFRVTSVENYNAMNVMTRAMPNLQQITIGYLGDRLKYSDGEDPNEGIADYTTHDIEIISNFSKLHILDIESYSSLNGRYHVLFNSFPLLQKLSIKFCYYLKWDLEMLAGFPMLKELECVGTDHLTGNIISLRVLKETLEKVSIEGCSHVTGNFMELADYPHLKDLHLYDTAVTGDIRDIGENDFSSLESLDLPKGVYGGSGYELQRLSDAPDLMRALNLFNKKRPTISMSLSKSWCAILSADSPDWYELPPEIGNEDDTPFDIRIVEAGSRLGYRWQNLHDEPCEVNWLDPEPDRESSDYSKYIEELEQINSQVYTFRGYYQPPTEEEYHRLIEVLQEEGEWW